MKSSREYKEVTMKRYTQSAVSVLCSLLTFVAVTLFVPSFARAARLLWDEQSAAVQDGAATEVTVEDFGAVGDGVHELRRRESGIWRG